MIQKEILEFLEEKPGYAKKGSLVLQAILEDKDMFFSQQDCADSLKAARGTILVEKEVVKNSLKVLIYDIEVSYNLVKSWSLGKTYLTIDNIVKERQVICVSYKWLGEDEVYTLSWDANQEDKFLIEQFFPVLNEADIIVAHNGDKFDLSWLKGRALKHGVEVLPYYNQVDTYKLAKRHLNLNSLKLDYLGNYFFGEKKIKVDYALWDRVIEKKEKAALKEMILYCEQDVKLLEKVYTKLTQLERSPVHVGALFNKNKNSSPISGSTNLEFIKKRATAQGTIKYIMRDLDTDSLFEMTESSYNKWKNVSK